MKSLYSSISTPTIRYPDTDMAGVVHHAKFLEYFEQGRIELFDRLGLPYSELQKSSIGFVIHSLSMTLNKPLRFGDQIKVQTHIMSLSKITMLVKAYIYSGETRHAEMEVKLACMDESSWKLIRIPEELLEKLPPSKS